MNDVATKAPPKLGKPLSAVMAEALGETFERGGTLIRHVGGYWSYPGCPRRSHDGVPEWYVGSSTVQALVDRGELEWTEWKDGRSGRFPIRASLPAKTGDA
jgi:hypothetical protein